MSNGGHNIFPAAVDGPPIGAPDPLLARLLGHVRRDPGKLAYVEVGPDGAGATLTYGQLVTRAGALAARLRGPGVPGDAAVLIAGANTVDLPVAFVAALLADRAALLVPATAPAEELRSIAAAVGPAAAVVNHPAADALRDAVRHVTPLDAHPGPEPPANAAGAALTDHTATTAATAPRLLLQSSGTTGRPKIVCRSGASLDAVAAQVCDAVGFAADDVVLATVPLTHSYGLEHGLLSPLYAGATVLLAAGLDLPTILRALGADGSARAPEARHADSLAASQPAGERPQAATERKARPGVAPATIFPGVPSIFEMLAEHAPAGTRFPALRRAYSAGGPLPRDLQLAVTARLGLTVGQLYGATEIGSVAYGGPEAPGFAPASVGRPMAGVSVRLDPDGQVLVRAASMFAGYLGATDTPTTPDGYFPTGDLGALDADGNLTLTGRLKLLIDVGGLKVNPLEVEQVLCQHPGVAACVVVPVAQTRTVSRVKAVVTPTDPARPPLEAELKQFARERLSSYKVPRVVEFRDALPRSATGKVLRHLVQAP